MADGEIGSFRAPAVELNYFANFAGQMQVMVKRNLTQISRNWKATIAQTIGADPYPLPQDLAPVALCQGAPTALDSCLNVLYFPNEKPYQDILKSFSDANERRGGPAFAFENSLSDLSFTPTTKMGFTPVSSVDFIYDYSLLHPNVTKWAVTFNQTNTINPITNLTVINMQYQVWFNYSLVNNVTSKFTDLFGNEILSFVRGMDEAIVQQKAYPSGNVKPMINIATKDFPLIPASTLSDGIVVRLGAVFFFCSGMVIFISVLNQIVSEKEEKLRIALEMMGLMPTVFWMSNFLTTTILVIVNSLVTVVLGFALGFNAFTQTSFAYGEAMVALAFFITTLVRKAQAAILIGVFFFVIGLLFENFIFSSTFIGYIWYENVETIDPIAWKIMIFIPFFNFGKMFLDISTLTTGSFDQLTQTFIAGPGYPWKQIYDPIPLELLPNYGEGLRPVVPPSIDTIVYLIMNICLYLALTLYFDQVIPNEYGVSKRMWYFLLPSYWGFGGGKNGRVDEERWLERVRKSSGGIVIDDEDGDVVDARNVALLNDTPATIRVINLRKVFKRWWFFKSKTDKIAVKDICLTLEEGKLLALLGQNGAGKSTTMNILSGLTPASKGDALIYGYSVRDEMQQITKFLGVCPQHDILFPDLTAVEHIKLYAGLKGVPPALIPRLIEDRLKCVKLWQVRNTLTATYSGGMRRRLSLVISTIGDPKVIFMDEPTTGMDPVNRRHVWGFIEGFKQGRVIVLTSHSMEEADVLGDRIAIMAHGAIRALGNATRLKGKFGAGYRLNLITEVEFVERVKEEVMKRVGEAVVEDESAGSLLFQVPDSAKGEIPGFVDWLEQSPMEVVKSWGISQSTLEEVFLRILRAANPDGYNGYEKKKTE